MLLSRLRFVFSIARGAEPNGARRCWRRRVFAGVFIGLCIAVAAESGRILFGGNVHEVMPGRVYRTAQLSPAALGDLIRSRGIRTVINLRGCCAGFDWYEDECRVTHELNVSQEDITLSAHRLPARCELRRLIEVLDRAEYPIVLHCRQGADRTGLAATVYLLLHSDADVPAARCQCSPRYAHFRVLSTANMDRFLDMYEEWLHIRAARHSADCFRAWALNEYRPDPAPARLELLGEVAEIRAGDSGKLCVRATNLSKAAWEFKTGTCTAIHVRYVVNALDGRCVGILRAGRFEARVAPGEAIDLDVPLPPLHTAGTYRIVVDMADRHVNFSQLGSECLELEIRVTDSQGR